MIFNFAPSRCLLPLTIIAVLTGEIRAQDAKPAANPALAYPESLDGLPGAGPMRGRFEWFKNLWTQKRTKWAADTAKDQEAVVFLGDSITQGWGDDLGGNFAGVKIANRGISGDTTRGMLTRLDGDVLALHPKAVVMLMGTNDLEEQAEPDIIAGNVKLIIAALEKQNAKIPLVLCQVFPSSATKGRPAEKIKKLNDALLNAVKGDSQVTVIDTWSLFANEVGDARPEEFPDVLHPNKTGYAKWAAALKPVFSTLGFMETEPDNFQPEPGFTSLFNGKDLTGWGFRAADGTSTNFDGLSLSSDNRYLAKNGKLIVTTPPEKSRIAQIYTTREFPKNFTLKLEFRATPKADSGVFLRKPQLQCRDYLLAGPYKTLTKYRPQDWNEMVVVVKDNIANCTCNGEVLEAALQLPATGPIGLEGDQGQMEYRHIQIQEQP